MARAYAAQLGCIALTVVIVRHWYSGATLVETFPSAVGLLLIFSVVGFLIGSVADGIIRQSVEQNFRRSVEKLQNNPDSMVQGPR